MSLAQLNTTTAHEAGTVYHVEYHHPAKDERGRATFGENGQPIIERVEQLMNDGKPVELILVGPDSDRLSKAYFSGFNLEREAAFAKRPLTVEENAKINSARWCAAIIGWHNWPRSWVDNSGSDQPIPYSPENAKAMFANVGMSWLGERIDAVTGDRNRFLPGSSPSSTATPGMSSATPKAASPRRSPKP
jgi:hypothetical protein